jgi:signal transduction histidine kinase
MAAWGAKPLVAAASGSQFVPPDTRLHDLAGGALVFVALYNLALFIKRRNDRVSLFLGIFSLLILGYHFGFYSINLFFCLGPWVMSLALKECFPKQLPSYFIKALGYLAFTLPFLGFFWTASTKAAPSVAGLATIALCASVMKAMLDGERGAKVSLVGFFILVFMQLFSWQRTEFMSTFLTVGLIAFTIAQSQIVTQRFAAAFRQAEYLSASLKDEIVKQTRDMSCILENIQQGIFTIDDDELRVGSQTSTHLAKILRLPTDDTPRRLDTILLPGLQLTEDQKSQITSVVQASVGEDALNFEANVGRLPKEALYSSTDQPDEKALEIEWTPMLASDDTLEKLLVCVRDVSEVRRLQIQDRRNREDLRLLEEVLSIPEDRMLRFLKRTRELIHQNARLINSSVEHADRELIHQLFINMHTVKGMARSYDLQIIATLSHEIEQHYATLRSGLAKWDTGYLLTELERLGLVVERYETLGREKLGWTQQEKFLKLPQAYFGEALHELETLAAALPNHTASERQQLSAMEEKLLNWAATGLSKVIMDCCKGLDSLAKELGKEPPVINFNDDLFFLNQEAADALSAILVHLLRNALDHGLEAPQRRVQQGKSSRGTITFRALQCGSELFLEMEDDGQGLDLKAIEFKARSAGLIAPHQHLAPGEIAQYIFHSGLSTKTEVTDISGRGVGLDAVRTYLAKLDASIAVKIKSTETNPCPFFFRVALPAILWRRRMLGAETEASFLEAV